MWFIPLLVIGAFAFAAASRSPRAASPPPIAGEPPLLPSYAPYALPPPALPDPTGPIAALDECVLMGQVPPSPVIICAIAEAEAIGRDDIATDIVRDFGPPVVHAPPVPQAYVAPLLPRPLHAPEPAMIYDRGGCYLPAARSIGPATPKISTYERGSCAPLPASPRASADRGRSRPTRSPRAASFRAPVPMPMLPPMPMPPAPAPAAGPSDFPTTDEEIRDMLNADPEKLFAMATNPAVPPPPAPTFSPSTTEVALAEELLSVPGHAGTGVVLVDPSKGTEVFEVRWLRGYPIPPLPRMIGGRPVQLVLVDDLPQIQAPADLPEIQAPAGLPPEMVAQMQEAAGEHGAADQTRALAPGSPIAIVSDDAWRQFVMRLAREAPTFNSSRHVGQYRQRRERLADLGIDPAAILGSAEAQRMALDADLVDAHHHAVEGGLVGHVGRAVAVPGHEEPMMITLSGLLGIIQCAGLDGAVGWLEKLGDRKRYPHTTQAFVRTNGVF